MLVVGCNFRQKLVTVVPQSHVSLVSFCFVLWRSEVTLGIVAMGMQFGKLSGAGKWEGIMRIYRREASEIIVGIIRRKSPLQTL